MKRLLAVLAGLALALVGTMAVAAWLSTGSGTATAAATSVDRANAATATRGEGTVELTWVASTLASGHAVSGYEVVRHEASTSTVVCTVTSPTCIDTAPLAGPVSYGVVATVGGWRGPESAPTPFTYDDVAPVTTAQVAPAPNAATWNNTAVTVTLEAIDSGSPNAGVDHISYSVDGVAPVDDPGATASFTVSGAGTHLVTYSAIDGVGNAEAPHGTTVRIDPSAPVTSASASPAPNAAGWNKTDVTLSFSASDVDASGVKSVTVDGVTTSGSTASRSVTAEGTTTVSYFATDVADNVEGTKTTTVRIDRTAPSVTIDPASSSSWTGDNSIALTASDPLSGVASIQYTVDAGPIQTYTGTPFTLADGSHSVQVTATDVAGNQLVQSATVKVDTVRPTSTIAQTTSNTWTVTASDAAPSSGVSIEHWVDSGAHTVASGGSAVVTVPTGSHTIHWFARDAAGNQQAEQTLNVSVSAFVIVSRTSAAPQNTTTLNGTGTPGASVTVYLCNGTQVSCGPTGPSANAKGPQTATVGANGSWSVVFDKLSNGAATFTAQAVQTSPSATSNVFVFSTS